MATMNEVKAVGYVRVSTEDQRDNGWNLDEDRRRIEAMCMERNWRLLNIYDDGGRQGDDPDRPGLLAMLSAAGEFDVLIVRAQDRLTRDTGIWSVITKALSEADVRIETFVGPLELESPQGELVGNIFAALGRFEKRLIGQRVKQAMQARARSGRHHGRAPFGYDVHMNAIESEAAVIRRIFREHVEGVSQREIARRLNRDGINAQRGNWTQGAVSKQLATPAYIGKVRFNGEVYDGDHEPIVDLGTWNKAQALRQANTVTKRAKNPAGQHLLGGGMLHCNRCGASMYATTRIRPDRKTLEQYVCSSRQRKGLDACDQPTVMRKPIDEAIWRFVTETALDLDATRRTIIERRNTKLADVATLKQQAERDAAKAQERLTRVRGHFQDGRMDPDDWQEQRAELTDSLRAAQAQVERLGQQHQAVIDDSDQGDAQSVALEELTAIKASIMGEAKEGSHAGVQAFRAALRRLFEGFVLVPHGTWPESGDIGGVIWPQDEDRQGQLVVDGYSLLPHVRGEALEWNPQKPWAPHKVALTACAFNANTPPLESRPMNTPRAPRPPAAMNG